MISFQWAAGHVQRLVCSSEEMENSNRSCSQSDSKNKDESASVPEVVKRGIVVVVIAVILGTNPEAYEKYSRLIRQNGL